MKKNIILTLLILCSIFFLLPPTLTFSLDYNFSDINLEDFVENIKNKKKPNLSSLYIWQGTINDITVKNNHKEILIIKAHWIKKRDLVSYSAILNLNSTSKYYNAKFLKQGIKIIFIVRIQKIKNEVIPVCTPIFLKKL